VKLAKLLGLLREPRTWGAILSTHTAPAVEHLPMLQQIRPDLVIDVGASRGQFALAAMLTGARDIISFEPIASEGNIYRRNMKRHNSAVLHACALADAPGEAVFFIADRLDSSSLLKLGAGQESAFGVRGEGETRVPVRRLDDVVTLETIRGRNSLLKIDVQGAERSVLLGATKVLSEVQYVFAECSYVTLYQDQALAGDIIELMRDAGFALRGVYNAVDSKSFGPTQADFLFANRRRVTEASA
jgi:FkbM family methyltransferase